jgi:DNA-binding response OmpR family regulator
MVVDDEPDIRRLVTFTLTRRGFLVIEAADGGAAVKMACRERPDLILMDVMMPLMDGHEATKLLKADSRTSHIPILMLSAKSQLAERQEGIESGALSYICKPFTPKNLVREVETSIGGAAG